MLELYASGLLTPEEIGEVEEMVSKYPEVKEELRAIEEALAMHASQFHKEPKPGLLDAIMTRIDEEEEGIGNQNENQNRKEAPIVPLEMPKEEKKVHKFNFMRLMAVAATLLLLISAIVNIVLYQQLTDTEQQLATIQDEQSVLAGKFDRLRTNYQVIADTAYKSIRVIGGPAHQAAFATVYWNPQNEAIYLDASALQSPSEDKTFQLWAIKAGQNPISLGVFDTLEDLQSIADKIGGDVAAFAVSLEPKGGSEQPTDVWMVGEV